MNKEAMIPPSRNKVSKAADVVNSPNTTSPDLLGGLIVEVFIILSADVGLC
jgi:hypothetical protein